VRARAGYSAITSVNMAGIAAVNSMYSSDGNRSCARPAERCNAYNRAGRIAR
jgi:hypothetical protein